MSTAATVRHGFHTVTPYLLVGETPVPEFLKQAFGAEELNRGSGGGGGFHMEMRIADSMLMIGGGSQWKPVPTSLHLYVPDADAVYHRALAAGAVSTEEPVDQVYGDREAGLRDPGGNVWWIATRKGISHLPEGLRAVTPFLHVSGAAGYIELLQTAFGAETLSRFEAKPGTIAHAIIRIGDSSLELAEAHDHWTPMPSTFYVYVPDADQSYARALQAGMTSMCAPSNQSYGDRMGGLIDSFGNSWYVATHVKE